MEGKLKILQYHVLLWLLLGATTGTSLQNETHVGNTFHSGTQRQQTHDDDDDDDDNDDALLWGSRVNLLWDCGMSSNRCVPCKKNTLMAPLYVCASQSNLNKYNYFNTQH